jgi:hypothetical protein
MPARGGRLELLRPHPRRQVQIVERDDQRCRMARVNGPFVVLCDVNPASDGAGRIGEFFQARRPDERA